ncbi:hypothetical protein MMA231_00961 [Asticcacaulis sp. MM231]|uniref:phage protein Gp27 family protein n=1 Tax=Asticcacaulis sp. MM231 TaxID=3157666 RepID=UPI0032D59462
MGEKRHRASSVDKLPEPIRHTVGRLIASNFTLDQIVDKLKELEATAEIDFEAPSRSALGRYAERLRAAQERIGRSRAIAEALAPTFGENPDNQVGRLAAEVLQTVIFDIMTAVEVDEETGEFEAGTARCQGSPVPGEVAAKPRLGPEDRCRPRC